MSQDTAKPMPLAKGRGELVKYLQGSKLTPKKAILAKCYECMGRYVDGKVSCDIPHCPLYPLMPYRLWHSEGKKISAK